VRASIEAAELRWGAVEATLTGLVALDGALQPSGSGTLRLAGGPLLLDAALAAGMIGRREAEAARWLLALSQRVPPQGGPPQIELPISLGGGVIGLGGVVAIPFPVLMPTTGDAGRRALGVPAR
jgi:hypothetical protein